jgi:hypothetical protein
VVSGGPLIAAAGASVSVAVDSSLREQLLAKHVLFRKHLALAL